MNKKIKIIIISSLCLNLLLTGIVIGHVSHHLGMHRIPRADNLKNIPDLQEKQKMIIEKLKDIYQSDDAVKDELKKVREDSLTILSAPEFNESAYQNKIEEMLTLRDHDRRFMANAVKEYAKGLDHDERAVLAEILRHPQNFRNYRNKNKSAPPGPPLDKPHGNSVDAEGGENKPD